MKEKLEENMVENISGGMASSDSDDMYSRTYIGYCSKCNKPVLGRVINDGGELKVLYHSNHCGYEWING